MPPPCGFPRISPRRQITEYLFMLEGLPLRGRPTLHVPSFPGCAARPWANECDPFGVILHAHFFLKISFGIIPCTPLTPSSSWVVLKSTATLDSMYASSGLRFFCLVTKSIA